MDIPRYNSLSHGSRKTHRKPRQHRRSERKVKCAPDNYYYNQDCEDESSEKCNEIKYLSYEEDDCKYNEVQTDCRGSIFIQCTPGPDGPAGPDGPPGPTGPGGGPTVTLTNAGNTGESLVVDGTGPALSIRSISSGNKFIVVDNIGTTTSIGFALDQATGFQDDVSVQAREAMGSQTCGITTGAINPTGATGVCFFTPVFSERYENTSFPNGWSNTSTWTASRDGVYTLYASTYACPKAGTVDATYAGLIIKVNNVEVVRSVGGPLGVKTQFFNDGAQPLVAHKAVPLSAGDNVSVCVALASSPALVPDSIFVNTAGSIHFYDLSLEIMQTCLTLVQ